MQRWVVLFVVGVLFLSSFAFAGQFQEVKDLQVPVSSGACSSCQDFDVDKALSEINLKIENLTRVINQKEEELQELYQKARVFSTNETWDRILMLETELAYKRADLLFYQAFAATDDPREYHWKTIWP